MHKKEAVSKRQLLFLYKVRDLKNPKTTATTISSPASPNLTAPINKTRKKPQD